MFSFFVVVLLLGCWHLHIQEADKSLANVFYGKYLSFMGFFGFFSAKINSALM